MGSGPPGIRVRYVNCLDYDTTGSVITLVSARNAVQSSPFLLLESDLLYHPDFLTAALNDPRENVMLVADATGSGDEVFICAGQDGALTYLGKDASAERRASSLGEFAGITRLSRGALDKYCFAAGRLRNTTGHYEELLYALAKAGTIALHTHLCAALPWTEVDVPEDLMRAERDVLPMIVAVSDQRLRL